MSFGCAFRLGAHVSYREDGYRNKTRWVGVVFIILLLGWCASLALPDRATPETVERDLLSSSRNGEIFKTLKASHPAEFEQLKAMVISEQQKGTDTAQIATEVGNFMLKIENNLLREVMRAPHAELTMLRKAEIEMVRAFSRSDIALCASYALTSRVETAGRPPQLERMMATFFAAKLRAAGAAGKTPVDHKISIPTDAQWREVGDLMLRQNVTTEELSMLGDLDKLKTAPLSVQCRLGVAYLNAIDQLPGERANLFYLGASEEADKAARAAQPAPTS